MLHCADQNCSRGAWLCFVAGGSVSKLNLEVSADVCAVPIKRVVIKLKPLDCLIEPFSICLVGGTLQPTIILL